MGFINGTTMASSISKASRCHVLSQTMDLNCPTWIVNLGLVEQRHLHTDLVVSTPLVSSLSTRTVDTTLNIDIDRYNQYIINIL